MIYGILAAHGFVDGEPSGQVAGAVPEDDAALIAACATVAEIGRRGGCAVLLRPGRNRPCPQALGARLQAVDCVVEIHCHPDVVSLAFIAEENLVIVLLPTPDSIGDMRITAPDVAAQIINYLESRT